jgi:hypothetical protein
MILRLSHPRTSTIISLIGVNHKSAASRLLVSDSISSFSPHYTCLELDASRASTISLNQDLGQEMAVAMSHSSTMITRFIDQQDIFFSRQKKSDLRREFGITHKESSNESPSWIGYAVFRAAQWGIFGRDLEKAIEDDCERYSHCSHTTE